MEMEEFAQGTVTAILDKFVEPILKGIAGKAKDEWEKFKADFDLAFFEYQKNARAKYSKIKTILYRMEPKYLYDFFECPYLEQGNGTKIKADSAYKLLQISHFLIVQGTGGIGKSTMMKHLFLNQLDYYKNLIPIFLELKDLNDAPDDYSIRDFMFQKLYHLGSTINKDCLDYVLKSGRFLFLLDGYDEIVTQKRTGFFKKLGDFCDLYGENYFLISSRPFSDFIDLQRFTILTALPFNKEQAISMIGKISCSGTEVDEETKKRFIAALDAELYDSHESFASNPLLLSMMLLTYNNYAEVPSKLHVFYERAFSTMYERHDATKAAFRREIRSGLAYDDFKSVFSYFCFISYDKGELQFSKARLTEILKESRKRSKIEFDVDCYLYDLLNAVCVLFLDGLDSYYFTHRSFQEYFTALFLKESPDMRMQRMALRLIHKDVRKASDDHVFSMLYSMAKERYENYVLLPLLHEIEQNIPNLSKYDFYFSQMKIELCKYRDKTSLDWVVYSDDILTSSHFMLKSVHRRDISYYQTNRAYLEKCDQKFIDYLMRQKNYAFDVPINPDDVLHDPEARELFKGTWVNHLISELSGLREKLEKQQEEIMLEWEDS